MLQNCWLRLKERHGARAARSQSTTSARVCSPSQDRVVPEHHAVFDTRTHRVIPEAMYRSTLATLTERDWSEVVLVPVAEIRERLATLDANGLNPWAALANEGETSKWLASLLPESEAADE